ncbi:MAG: endo-1,4-beta-xylanase [Alphaproteobacteria bacterium]
MSGSPFHRMMINRRLLLQTAGAASLAAIASPWTASPARAAPSLSSPSLGEIAGSKGLFFASWLPFTAFNLPDQPRWFPKAPDEIADIYRYECAGFVGNAKNDEIMLDDGRLDGARPVRIFEFAKPTGKPIIWHALFWNRASPYIASIKDRKQGIATLKSWIQNFLTHWDNYPVHSIQVVNELHYPWSDHQWGYWTKGPKGAPHPWLSVIGDDAPELAFKFAAEVAAPGTKLILNEQTWALTSGNLGAYERNRKHILATLRRWLDAKVPINGLGLQTHITPGFAPIGARLLPSHGDYIDPKAQLKFFDEVAALGLEIHLTEFDCSDIYLAGKSRAERREECASYTRAFLKPLLKHKAVRSFQLWGMTDNLHDSYLADPEWDKPDRRWGDKPTAPRPREAMPYDAGAQPKPLRAAIADVLAAAPARS